MKDLQRQTIRSYESKRAVLSYLSLSYLRGKIDEEEEEE